jgi:hypothetical protein
MLGKLITHSWLLFVRSELFKKSLFVMLMLALTGLFILIQVNLAGKLLPGLLHEHFPSRTPGAWVYGFLIPLMLFDLSTRLFLQKLPARQLQPYAHLPISRIPIALYWIIKSWLHPINFYLPFFFYPFIKQTINPETSSQAMGLAGIFMLTAINQGLYMWLQSSAERKTQAIATMGIVAAITAIAYTWFTDAAINFSLSMFMGFVNSDIAVISIVLAIIVLLHGITFLRLQINTHSIFEQDKHQEKKVLSNPVERIIARVPVFGPYWLLEWRLVTRNKRSKYNFFFMIPVAVAFVIYLTISAPERPESFMAFLVMMAGGYGFYHLQYAFSWESHFFDFIASRNMNINSFIRAKYNFYIAYATVQFILVFPFWLWVSTSFALMLIGLFFYVCGFVFFFYLRTGLTSSTRLDANGRSLFNMEGVTGLKYLQVLLLFLSFIPLVIIGEFLTFPHSHALLLGITGLAFFATQKWWINGIANKYNRVKYKNLNLYRQK